jgi:hypothetical protein
VYVYVRIQKSWMLQAYVKASNPEAGDSFGFSVALDRDTLAVGAIFEDSNATGVDGDQGTNGLGNSGAVYLLTRQSNAWTQRAYIKSTNPDIDDQFGYSVSVAGDTLAVGAWIEDSAARGINQNQDDDSAAQSGAVYVFMRDNDTWTPQAYIKASNTEPSALFGGAVSVQGDTLAVGAYRETAGGAGAVYVIQ